MGIVCLHNNSTVTKTPDYLGLQQGSTKLIKSESVQQEFQRDTEPEKGKPMLQ